MSHTDGYPAHTHTTVNAQTLNRVVGRDDTLSLPISGDATTLERNRHARTRLAANRVYRLNDTMLRELQWPDKPQDQPHN